MDYIWLEQSLRAYSFLINQSFFRFYPDNILFVLHVDVQYLCYIQFTIYNPRILDVYVCKYP